jgi:hypothetical protein
VLEHIVHGSYGNRLLARVLFHLTRRETRNHAKMYSENLKGNGHLEDKWGSIKYGNMVTGRQVAFQNVLCLVDWLLKI